MEVSRNADKFNCKACPHHHCDDSGEWEDSRGPAPYALWEITGPHWPGGRQEFKTCLLPMITPLSRELLKLHLHYRAGHLPVRGGALDQPAAFLQAMEIIESVPIKVED